MNRDLRTAGATVALLAASACGQMADTPELRLEKAREVAQLEVQGGALDEALNLGADIAMAASLDALVAQLGREATTAEQTRVRDIFRDALAEFLTPATWVDASATVYARHLTPSELDDLANFYRTTTGSKILSLQEEMTTELGDAAEQIVVENELAFAESVDAALAEAFPELAQGSGR